MHRRSTERPGPLPSGIHRRLCVLHVQPEYAKYSDASARNLSSRLRGIWFSMRSRKSRDSGIDRFERSRNIGNSGIRILAMVSRRIGFVPNDGEGQAMNLFLFGWFCRLRLRGCRCAVEFFKFCNIRLGLHIWNRWPVDLRTQKGSDKVSNECAHHRHASGSFGFVRQAGTTAQMSRQIVAPLQLILCSQFLAAVRAGTLTNRIRHRIALSTVIIAQIARIQTQGVVCT